MHDLSKYTMKTLMGRLNELQTGPNSWYESRNFYCRCDIDCPWDSFDAIEAELVRREMRVMR